MSAGALPATGAVFVRSCAEDACAEALFEAEAFAQECAEVLVLAEQSALEACAQLPENVEAIEVAEPQKMPLGILAQALSLATHDWLFVALAPVPAAITDAGLIPALLRDLWAARDGAEAVVMAGAGGIEPWLGLYHKDCLSAVKRALASGRQRMAGFLPSVSVAEIPVPKAVAEAGSAAQAVRLAAAAHEAAACDTSSSAKDAEAPSVAAKPKAPHEAAAAVAGAGAGAATGAAVTVSSVKEKHGGRLPSEHAITVHMNGVEIATVQSSPWHLEEMAVGFLLAEGLIHDRDALRSVSLDETRGMVYIETDESVPDEMVFKKRYITSGCGKGVTFSSVGHAKGLDRVTSDVVAEPEALLAMVHELSSGGEERKNTGGVHGCAFGRGGKTILIREDIGRHNAVDKLLGRAWLDRIPTHDLVLLSTGRVSYEMAVKAAKARVPIVVSRSAVTDLAAEITEELGVTLVAYCRGNSMVACTHPRRIRGAQA
ncbi:MAG: formate dehydrogenase accessory sulfurtransferase FdhD [Coriobacteriia bacterium]|nr:formate dehydrogenase accessory sulfurtransferase FdhD [Coriobacteriia bacterium]